MRRSEREIRDPAAVEEILTSTRVVHLAMVDGGEPYVVAMNYAYADRALWLHSAREGRKIEILRRTPRVCFSVVESCEIVPAGSACGYGARYRSVTGVGVASLIEDPVAVRAALDRLMASVATGPFTYASSSLARMLAIRVDIEQMTGKQSGY